MQSCCSILKEPEVLKKAIDFHGHLGPYLVLGLLMGNTALKKNKDGKYFGMEVVVRGATQKPKSCLIDGLQISTGCTYGKGNIRKIKGKRIQASFRNLSNNKKFIISLKNGLIKKLDSLTGHKDSEILARRLIKSNPRDLFEFK